KVRPWQISFKNTMQTLNEMLPILSAIEDHGRLCETMLDCCLKHVVGNRPDRYEPRVVKRRPKSYTLMTKPRDQYKPGES
ncbi:MAG: IS4 family transposase, partial [Pirellula staleyi]